MSSRERRGQAPRPYKHAPDKYRIAEAALNALRYGFQQHDKHREVGSLDAARDAMYEGARTAQEWLDGSHKARDWDFYFQTHPEVTPNGRTGRQDFCDQPLDVHGTCLSSGPASADTRLTLLRGLTIGVAMSRATIEYAHAARVLGVHRSGMGRYCDLLAEDCVRRGEPNLAALIVSRRTGTNTGWDGSSLRPLCYRHWAVT